MFGHNQGNLSLGYMRYFEMTDVGEAPVYELAIATLGKDGTLTKTRNLEFTSCAGFTVREALIE